MNTVVNLGIRSADDTGLDTEYIVVELASNLLGKDWQQDFVAQISQGGVERVLL